MSAVRNAGRGSSLAVGYFPIPPQTTKSFFHLFAFALPASLHLYNIYVYNCIYPANMGGVVSSGGGWRWWRHGRNSRRIGWAHTKSQETSLALCKWDTNVRGTCVLVHACMYVCTFACVCANALCRSVVPVSASASVVRETWMWTEHPRGKNDQAIRKVCDKFASVWLCVCVRIWRTVSMYGCLFLCVFVCVFVRARIIILTECAAFAVITNWYSYVAATITIRGAGSPTLAY